MEDKIQLIDEISFELDNIAILDEFTESEEITVTATTDEQVINPERGKMFGKVTVKAVTNEIDENIMPTNIRAGVSILGVQGNLEPDKPDQTKTVTPTTEEQTVVADTGYELASVKVEAVNPEDYYKEEIIATINPLAIEQNIVPENNKVFNKIKVLAVNPADYYKTEETLNISPITEQQTIEADAGKVFNLVNVDAVDPKDYQKEEGAIHLAPSTEAQTITPQENHVFNEVNIDAVTSEIDSNIKAENIKEGVSILGVEGNFKTIEQVDDINFIEFFNGKLSKLEHSLIFKIQSYVFYSNTAIKEVSLVNCFSIGGNAFVGCTNLKSLYLPRCYSLSSLCWQNCYNLSSISLPALQSLSGQIFAGMSGLKLMNLDITSISGAAFGVQGTSITDISLPLLTNRGGSNTFASGSFVTKCFAPKFSGSAGCFLNCTKLEDVKIWGMSSNSVFANCKSLKSLYLYGDTISPYGNSVFNSTPIVDSSYLGYYGSIYVPASLVEDYKAATGWSSISERITAISGEDDIFTSIYSRTTITEYPVEENLKKYISKQAFVGCQNLVNIENSNIYYIDTSAFSFCQSLKSVNLNNCAFVGSRAFDACTKLKEVNMPNLIIASSSAFISCYNLITINLPKLRFIEIAAFERCQSLVDVNLPEVLNIKAEAFSGCTNLRTINLPNCYFISSNCFYECVNLENCNAENVFFVLSSAFYNCSKLASMTFNIVSSFTGDVFRGCTNLSAITLKSPFRCSLAGGTAFASTPITDSSYLGYYGSIYVPASLVSEYKEATNWAIYSDRITSII